MIHLTFEPVTLLFEQEGINKHGLVITPLIFEADSIMICLKIGQTLVVNSSRDFGFTTAADSVPALASRNSCQSPGRRRRRRGAVSPAGGCEGRVTEDPRTCQRIGLLYKLHMFPQKANVLRGHSLISHPFVCSWAVPIHIFSSDTLALNISQYRYQSNEHATN